MTTPITHDVKIGDIFYTSWGYEQTNTEFYQVTKVTAHMVWLREVAKDTRPIRMMVDDVEPRRDVFVGEEFRRKLSRGFGRYSVRINDVADAWPWEGDSKTVSHYA